MFLKISNYKNGKTFLSIVHGYRDEQGNSKQKTIETIGYLDELKKQYDDPIAHFKNIAHSISNTDLKEYTIKNLNSKIVKLNDKPKNLGYVAIKRIYNELGIEALLKDIQTKANFKYNLNDILSFLVFMRILKPGSKLDNFQNKNLLFENFNFSLNDIYRSLTSLNLAKDKIEKVMWDNSKLKYSRDTSTCYYDCTNYYFEIEYNDNDIYELDTYGNVVNNKAGNPIIKQQGLRKRGPEKNHRPDPIVEMGLLMDSNGIPLSYDILPGNFSEKKSLIPIINRTKREFNLGRTIVVADRGLNTSLNIIKLSGVSLEQAKKLNGYVYGQSVRGADEEFKAFVLKQDYITDITLHDGELIKFIHKSRVYPKKVSVVRHDKEKTKTGNDKVQHILVDQKQMVYYSQKYADKQKRDRDRVIAKANDLIAHPDKYTKATSYGIAGYINNISFVKGSGEIANSKELSINLDRIIEEEKYDGYYSIVTSEEHLTDIEIRNIYRGLAKIEETFKVTKTGIEARPVWVSRNDHIEAHFLTCFIALVIIRLIEQRLGNKYPFNQIINSIRSYTSSNIEHDLYLQSYTDDIISSFENEFGINLSNKFKTLAEIKNILK